MKSQTFYSTTGEEIKKPKKRNLSLEAYKVWLSKAISNYLRKNFVYPEKLKDKGFEAELYASLQLNPNGSVDILKITSDAYEIFEIELLRVLESMPKFRPYIFHNLNIPIRFQLPVIVRHTVN